ncbi:transposable element Tcb2 transposase [Trichonephila clavipes]|nr:transposable element Tcb2 transposase [Trichonephila clavipes]
MSSRTLARRLTEGHLVTRHLLRALPMTPTLRCLRLEWCRARQDWTATEWNQVIFSDEYRFNFSSDDNRVRMWRPHDERLNPAFTLQLTTFYFAPTASTAGVMIWGAIVCDSRSPLIFIHDTMAVQWYVHAIFQPHVLPLMAGLPGAIFQQDNFRPHTERMLQDYLRHIITLLWHALSSDLSPSEHIWVH